MEWAGIHFVDAPYRVVLPKATELHAVLFPLYPVDFLDWKGLDRFSDKKT